MEAVSWLGVDQRCFVHNVENILLLKRERNEIVEKIKKIGIKRADRKIITKS